MHLGKKCVLFATTALCWTVPAYAQNAQGSEILEGNDIIVTARRVEERLQDVPISITVMNQETLTNRNISNAADLSVYTPSLSTNSRYGPEQASFSIRGFYQEQGTSPSVGIYFSDVVLPRASGTIGTAGGGGPGLLFDLQNVQVLKGPQGTLQGRNTTGGAILIVPQKPTDKLEGYVEGSYGNFNMRRAQAVLNVPLGDTFRVRGGIDWQKRDGYLNNRSGIGPDRLADTNYIAARLSVIADLTPDLENYTIFSYSNSDTNGSGLKALDCNRALAANPQFGFLAALGCAQIDRQTLRGDGFWDIENNAANSSYRARTWQVINTTTWTASENLTVKNIISYGEVKAFASSSLFGDNLLLPVAPGVSIPVPTLVYEPGRFGPNSSQSTFTEEFRLQGNSADDRFNWQAGVYFELSKPIGTNSQLTQIFASCTNLQTLQCNSGPLAFGTVTDTSTADTFNNKGFYAQGIYKLSDQFSLTGGFRYTIDRATQVAHNAVVSFPAANTPAFICQNVTSPPGIRVVSSPLACTDTLRQNSEKPTWLLGLDYKPTDDMLLYAKYSRGYRAGGMNSTNLNSSAPTWGPEKVDAYELGFKTSFRGAVRGNFNIAAFYNKFDNQQLSAIVSPISPFDRAPPAGLGLAQNQVILNAGKSQIWGIEVEASVTPFDGFRLDASYAYLNTVLQSIQSYPATTYYGAPVAQSTAEATCKALYPTIVGCSDLPFSPRNRLTLNASYTLPLSESVGAISLAATFVHTDRNNSTSFLTSPNLYRNTAQDLLNLNVNWNSVFGSPVDASFFMTNVTNAEDYLGDAGGYALATDAVVVAPPRMFGVRLRYSFGK